MAAQAGEATDSVAGHGAAHTATHTAGHAAPATLQRQLDWKGAFWAASGVPAGVLLTIGGVAATIGQPAWIVFIASILMGFTQSFTYAEIAGLFPHKSGGASVYGASAWVGYSKWVAPISVWCNWLAWSPVLALGTGLGASYVVTSLFPADALINTWTLTLADLGFVRQGLTLRINSVFVISTVFLLATFAMQHHGVGRAARLQMIMGIASLLPLLIVGLVPILTGDMPLANFFPLLPLAHDAAGSVAFGAWDQVGLTVLAGAMFTAGWSTYGFETAICYTREFRDPKRDTFKAIFSAGLICILVFTIVPIAFQGSLGMKALLDPGIYDGTGVGQAMARMVGGGAIVTKLIVVMLILSLLLIVMTSMMGSSRTLYQASVDGWLPRYLSRVNRHGAPTAAMWTDLVFNLFLLMLSDYFTILTVSNVCYLLFNFLNLQAGWIHRIDRPNVERPFRCPTWLLATGGVLGFVNMAFVGAGSDIWGAGTLRNGLIGTFLIVPVFWFRHYVQDKGVFPAAMRDDTGIDREKGFVRRAGILPWLTLAACVAVIAISHAFSKLPAVLPGS
jgi:amino acid transporter